MAIVQREEEQQLPNCPPFSWIIIVERWRKQKRGHKGRSPFKPNPIYFLLFPFFFCPAAKELNLSGSFTLILFTPNNPPPPRMPSRHHTLWLILADGATANQAQWHRRRRHPWPDSPLPNWIARRRRRPTTSCQCHNIVQKENEFASGWGRKFHCSPTTCSINSKAIKAGGQTGQVTKQGRNNVVTHIYLFATRSQQWFDSAETTKGRRRRGINHRQRSSSRWQGERRGWDWVEVEDDNNNSNDDAETHLT